MVKERAYLFINVLLGQWQSRRDLCVIMQCDNRTLCRYIKLFKTMCKTNELDNFILDEDQTFNGYIYGSDIKRYRIRIKKNG